VWAQVVRGAVGVLPQPQPQPETAPSEA
jgi:hypothetical protein